MLPNDLDVRTVLRNKKMLMGKPNTAQYSIISDQTPMQEKFLKDLRTELEDRKASGEKNITIKYIDGNPKIVSNFRQ